MKLQTSLKRFALKGRTAIVGYFTNLVVQDDEGAVPRDHINNSFGM